MAYYYRLGNIPPKRHTQFRQPDNSLYKEELVSSKGFSGIYSNLYHTFSPTQVKQVLPPVPYDTPLADYPLLQTHLKTSGLGTTGEDFLEARKVLMKNQDVSIAVCNPSGKGMDYFYKNGEADEVLYVHDGTGILYSQFGKLPFKKGDYVVIPRTTVYKLEFTEKCRFLVIEAVGPIETVKRYRNELGQLEEHSPYCERDIHPPQELVIEEAEGDYLVKIKKQGYLHQYVYAHSPLDVVGWDGFLYPYTLSIYDFEPITGRIHLPPPIHQTFQAWGFVICSFVPRLFDYHPLSIPAPYNHSNIDSDEVLFYAEGEFMSRKGIDRGSFTLHPGGLPHGPHPGTVEKSIGAKETHEYAVMIDTFKPLHLTTEGLNFVDKNYPYSWNE
ncbi:MAG: homogentisate 1,2-dioxygenase [Bacteroidetes bacterium]|nr:MAG: homogentisate 1,2-dioxygenase [Bacteroidota bacterium]